MSYIRTQWCLRSESNQRHVDFQSTALPTELQRQTVRWRPRTGSNRRPLAWQASALTNWATGPQTTKFIIHKFARLSIPFLLIFSDKPKKLKSAKLICRHGIGRFLFCFGRLALGLIFLLAYGYIQFSLTGGGFFGEYDNWSGERDVLYLICRKILL